MEAHIPSPSGCDLKFTVDVTMIMMMGLSQSVLVAPIISNKRRQGLRQSSSFPSPAVSSRVSDGILAPTGSANISVPGNNVRAARPASGSLDAAYGAWLDAVAMIPNARPAGPILGVGGGPAAFKLELGRRLGHRRCIPR